MRHHIELTTDELQTVVGALHYMVNETDWQGDSETERLLAKLSSNLEHEPETE